MLGCKNGIDQAMRDSKKEKQNAEIKNFKKNWQTEGQIVSQVAEGSFDLPTFGLWAQRANPLRHSAQGLLVRVK